jgi:thioredoxin-like negative regulator of GroEL
MPDSRIEDLRRRVEADPTSIAFAALAEEYRRVGRFQEAVEVCRRGLERHPAYLSAKVTLARALIELNELDEAQQHLDAVLRMAPENLAAIRARADIHRRHGAIPETFDFSKHTAAETAGGAATPALEGASRQTAVGRLETFLQAIIAERRRREAPGA